MRPVRRRSHRLAAFLLVKAMARGYNRRIFASKAATSNSPGAMSWSIAASGLRQIREADADVAELGEVLRGETTWSQSKLSQRAPEIIPRMRIVDAQLSRTPTGCGADKDHVKVVAQNVGQQRCNFGPLQGHVGRRARVEWRFHR